MSQSTNQQIRQFDSDCIISLAKIQIYSTENGIFMQAKKEGASRALSRSTGGCVNVIHKDMTLNDYTANSVLRVVIYSLEGHVFRSGPGTQFCQRSFLLHRIGRIRIINIRIQITYEGPEQLFITLTIYNLHGQEIVRLVDQSQLPVRYIVT